MAADLQIDPEDLARGIELTANLQNYFDSLAASVDMDLAVIGSPSLLTALQENMSDWSHSRDLMIKLAKHVNTGLCAFRDSLEEWERQLVNNLGDTSSLGDGEKSSSGKQKSGSSQGDGAAPSKPPADLGKDTPSGGGGAPGFVPTGGGVVGGNLPSGGGPIAGSGGGFSGGGGGVRLTPMHNPLSIDPSRLPQEFDDTNRVNSHLPTYDPITGGSTTNPDGSFDFKISSIGGKLTYTAAGTGVAGLTIGATVLSALANKNGNGGLNPSSMSPSQREFFKANGIDVDGNAAPSTVKKPMWKQLIERTMRIENDAAQLRKDMVNASKLDALPPIDSSVVNKETSQPFKQSLGTATTATPLGKEYKAEPFTSSFEQSPLDLGHKTQSTPHVEPLKQSFSPNLDNGSGSTVASSLPPLSSLDTSSFGGGGHSGGGGGFSGGGGGGMPSLPPLQDFSTPESNAASAPDLPPLKDVFSEGVSPLGDDNSALKEVEKLGPLTDLYDDTGLPEADKQAASSLGPLGLLAAPGGLAAGAGAGIGIANARKNKNDAIDEMAEESVYRLKKDKQSGQF